jgi:hypothetical protein
MFVGHYSVAFAAKSVESRIPLWLLFIAVQLADVFWSVFVWTGVERVRIVPGITASNPLDLYYMPYTHSLLAAVLWSLGAYVAYRLWRKGGGGKKAAMLVAMAVFSHWVLDFVVHRPDLPLWDDMAKVGLGLWNYPAVAFVLEAGLMFAGLVWYLTSTQALSTLGRYGMLVFGVLMLVVHSMAFFGSPPTSPAMAAGMALGSYVVLAAVAGWLERKRTVAA